MDLLSNFVDMPCTESLCQRLAKMPIYFVLFKMLQMNCFLVLVAVNLLELGCYRVHGALPRWQFKSYPLFSPHQIN